MDNDDDDNDDGGDGDGGGGSGGGGGGLTAFVSEPRRSCLHFTYSFSQKISVVPVAVTSY